MAFVQLEDMTGTVEVIVFPKTYDDYAAYLGEDAKIFIEGRVSLEEDKDAKLIAEKIIPFAEMPRTVWLRCADLADWTEKEPALRDLVKAHPGRDRIAVRLAESRQYKQLDATQTVDASDPAALEALRACFGGENLAII